MLAEGYGRKSRMHYGCVSVNNWSMIQQRSGTVDQFAKNHSTEGFAVSCTWIPPKTSIHRETYLG